MAVFESPLGILTNCKKINEGEEGIIYECDLDGLPIILKQYKKESVYENETSQLNEFNRMDVGAKLLSHWKDDTGYALFEKWDGSLLQLLQNIINEPRKYRVPLRTEMEQTVGVELEKLHRLGLFHNDLHKGNILYRLTPDGYHFTLTDFGQTSDRESKKKDARLWRKIIGPKGKYISLETTGLRKRVRLQRKQTRSKHKNQTRHSQTRYRKSRKSRKSRKRSN